MRKYHCPKCKNDSFEEINLDVTVSYQIVNRADGLDYGERNDHESGYVSHFQCESCGEIIMSPENHPVDSLDELAPALEALGPIPMNKNHPLSGGSLSCRYAAKGGSGIL